MVFCTGKKKWEERGSIVKDSFKKSYYFILILAIVFTMLIGIGGNCAVFASAAEIKFGDVNQDLMVDAQDALHILQYAAHISALDEDALLAADVTADDLVDANDALDVLKYAAHLIDHFQAEETKQPAQETLYDIPACPPDYKSEEAEEQGSVIQITYQTGTNTKYALAYLPFGYDENDLETKYNVFYLMHGGGNTVNSIFNGPGGTSNLKRMVDHMIQNGDMEPVIIVTPTYYNSASGGGNDAELAKAFPEEFVNDLVPAVESQLHTYAETTDREGLKQSRDHRAFGGFSMGSAITWYMFLDCLDYVKYYMPMSGDCWAVQQSGGEAYAEQTILYLIDSIEKKGYTRDDFFIYAMTGTLDMAYQGMTAQMEAAKRYPDMFLFGKDQQTGSICYNVLRGGQHTLGFCYWYVYHALPYFWTK